jgi:helix-turn-helix protein
VTIAMDWSPSKFIRFETACNWLDGSPTVRRRRLAAELCEIRESKGKSGDALAMALKWSPSKVSQYERATTGLRLAPVPFPGVHRQGARPLRPVVRLLLYVRNGRSVLA